MFEVFALLGQHHVDFIRHPAGQGYSRASALHYASNFRGAKNIGNRRGELRGDHFVEAGWKFQ